MHLATRGELLKATFRERRRRGWMFVAPQLEPYVGAQRWPSGTPLPDDLRSHVARRTRSPPWCPNWKYSLSCIAFALFGYIMCAGVMETYVIKTAEFNPWTCDGNICRTCMYVDAGFIAVLTLVLFGIVRANKAVQHHVDCLYVLYAISRAGTSDSMHVSDVMIHDVCVPRARCRPGRVRIRVWEDGSHDYEVTEPDSDDEDFDDMSFNYGLVSWRTVASMSVVRGGDGSTADCAVPAATVNPKTASIAEPLLPYGSV